MDRPEMTANSPELEPLKLNEKEKVFYSQLFKEADKGNIGVITGQDAVQFFGRTQLVSNFLGQLWQLVDVENRGFLTFLEFCQFLRLIAHAQHTKGQLSGNMINQPAPLPKFYPHETTTIPTVTEEDAAKYRVQFASLGPTDGIVPGAVVQSLLVSSQLPADRLGWIWNASKKDPSHSNFSVDEFTTAMHLVNLFKTGLAAGAVSPNVTGPRPNVGPVMPQFGQPVAAAVAMPTSMPPSMPTPIPAPAPILGPGPTAVGIPTKDDIDGLFNGLRGDHPYVTGEAASVFLERFRLPGEVLADIWDLADMDSDGSLDRDEFFVIMQLVYSKLTNPAAPVPTRLPDGMVPASKRHLYLAAAAAAPPAEPVSTSAAVDLLSLDMPSTSNVPVSQSAVVTGLSGQYRPDQAADSMSAFSTPATRSLSPLRQTFKPTSSFGQGIISQNTSGSQTGSVGQRSDIGAVDGAAVASANSEIAAIAQRSADLRTTKETIDRQQQQTSSELKIVRLRLSQVRSQFEKDEKHVAELRQQADAAAKSHLLAKQELASVAEDFNRLQAEQAALTNQLATLRTEHATMKDSFRKSTEAVSRLKAEIEKKKAEVRSQTNVNTIMTTQLASSEADVKRLQAEAETVRSSTASVEPSPQPAAVLSGASSPGPSMNPFRRRPGLSSDGPSRALTASTTPSEAHSSASIAGPNRHQSPFDGTVPGVLQPQIRPGSQADTNWSSPLNWTGTPASGPGSNVSSPAIRPFGESGTTDRKVSGGSTPGAVGSGRPSVEFAADPIFPSVKSESGASGTGGSQVLAPTSLSKEWKPADDKLTSASTVSPTAGDGTAKPAFRYDQFEAEFPPIKRQGDDEDDDADSTDSSFETGFDDNFTSTALGPAGNGQAGKSEANKTVGWAGSSGAAADFSNLHFGTAPTGPTSQSGVSLNTSTNLGEAKNPASAASVFDDLKPALEMPFSDPAVGLGPEPSAITSFDQLFDSPPSSPSSLSRKTAAVGGDAGGGSGWPLVMGDPNSLHATQQASAVKAVVADGLGRAEDKGRPELPII